MLISVEEQDSLSLLNIWFFLPSKDYNGFRKYVTYAILGQVFILAKSGGENETISACFHRINSFISACLRLFTAAGSPICSTRSIHAWKSAGESPGG
jgi:hypothetical protein